MRLVPEDRVQGVCVWGGGYPCGRASGETTLQEEKPVHAPLLLILPRGSWEGQISSRQRPRSLILIRGNEMHRGGWLEGSGILLQKWGGGWDLFSPEVQILNKSPNGSNVNAIFSYQY